MSLVSTAKRTTNGHARPMAERWVFGVIDTTDDAFIVEVPPRDRATLMPLIQQRIAPDKHFSNI